MKVIVNEQPSLYMGVIEDVAKVYMAVFGETEGVYEGGVRPDGATIPLSQYAGYITQEEGISMSLQPNTREIIDFIDWFENLPTVRQLYLMDEAERISGGYRPYYRYQDVVSRFKQDLTPSVDSVPIITYWGDAEYPVCGFVTQNVVRTPDAFQTRLDAIPILSQREKEQIMSHLRTIRAEYPIMFGLEGAVVPERAGKRNGSKWNHLLLEFYRGALDLGAELSIAITFLESKYYTNSIKNNVFIVDLPVISDKNEHSMRFVVLDLNVSYARLIERMERDVN